MTNYAIYVNGQHIKTYDSKYVAIIWCLMHGYGVMGRCGKWLDSRVEIEEVSDDE